jgi:hypothetical protein
MDDEKKANTLAAKFLKYSKFISENYINPSYAENGMLIGVGISIATMIILLVFF